MARNGKCVVGQRRVTDFDAVLGKKIRTRRLIAELSQAELGEKLGVTFQQVQKYEKGVNRVSASRLELIAKALNESLDYFQTTKADTSAAGVEIHGMMFDAINVRMLRAFHAIPDRELKFKFVQLLEGVNASLGEAYYA